MQESSLPKIVAVLRARAWLIVALAVPVLLAGLAYAATREPVYRSDAVVSFSPGAEDMSGSSFLRLVRTYQLVATSPDVLRAAEVKAGMPAGALSDAVSVESPGDTLQLALTVVTGTLDGAERGAEAVAEAIVETADRDPLVVAEFLIGPTSASNVTPVRQTIAVAAGAVLGLVPGISVAFLLEGARPRVRTRQDLAALGIPLLSTVSRRHLRRAAAGGSRSKDLPRRAGLRAHLRQSARDHHTGAVVVTSASAAEAGLATALASALFPAAAPAPDGERTEPGVRLVTHPGLLTDDGAAAAAVREHGTAVVVVTVGTRYDEVQECAQLVERLGAELVGVVLVR